MRSLSNNPEFASRPQGFVPANCELVGATGGCSLQPARNAVVRFGGQNLLSRSRLISRVCRANGGYNRSVVHLPVSDPCELQDATREMSQSKRRSVA